MEDKKEQNELAKSEWTVPELATIGDMDEIRNTFAGTVMTVFTHPPLDR